MDLHKELFHLASVYWVSTLYQAWTMCSVTQSCPTLCDPVNCSLPGSSVHGIFQAIALEWVGISLSSGSSRPRDRTQVSRIVDRCFTVWAIRQVFNFMNTFGEQCTLTKAKHALGVWYLVGTLSVFEDMGKAWSPHLPWIITICLAISIYLYLYTNGK